MANIVRMLDLNQQGAYLQKNHEWLTKIKSHEQGYQEGGRGGSCHLKHSRGAVNREVSEGDYLRGVIFGKKVFDKKIFW